MKTLSLFATLTFLVLFSGCEEKGMDDTEVPASVKKAFASEFPDMKAEWEKEGENYEAEFKVNGKKLGITYSPDGEVLETEEEIPNSALPPAIKDYVSQNYSGFEVDEAEKLKNSLGTFFEVEIEKDDEEKELLFDQSGKFVKEVVEMDDED